MAGVVYFKLRSAIETYQVAFDGVFISVSELKDIIMCKLGIDNDYRSDIKLSNAQTGLGAR